MAWFKSTSDDQRRDQQQAAQIEDARARGTNLVRVADVRQRHSTGTGGSGQQIRGRLHR